MGVSKNGGESLRGFKDQMVFRSATALLLNCVKASHY